MDNSMQLKPGMLKTLSYLSSEFLGIVSVIKTMSDLYKSIYFMSSSNLLDRLSMFV